MARPARSPPPILLSAAGAERSQATASAAVVAPSLVSAQNKSPQGDGTRCRDLPFTHIRAVRDGGATAALTCKRWRCPDCGPGLKRRLKRAFATAIETNPDLRRFFTLTLSGAARNLPMEERYAELSRSFARFRRRMARAQGRPFAYALVREPHRDGTPHIHGLTDRFVPFKELAGTWAACGGGYVDIRYVDPQRAAAYLSKYLSKDGNPPPKGNRKYGSGGGITLEGVRPKGEKGVWRIEVYGTQLDGRPGWHHEGNPGPFIGALATQRWLRETGASLAERLAQRVTAAELDALQRRLVVCIICGGDHDVHPAAPTVMR